MDDENIIRDIRKLKLITLTIFDDSGEKMNNKVYYRRRSRDPELLTIKGRRLIGCIYHSLCRSLVNPEILKGIKARS